MIILIDFRKREERRELCKLDPEFAKKMDVWIREYGKDDETPPNEDECSKLETDKIAALLAEYDGEAAKLWRVRDEVPKHRDIVKATLENRKGKLFAKFSGTVDELQSLAASCMQFCVNSLRGTEEELMASVPLPPSAVEKDFAELKKSCTGYINGTFPEGVEGMDNYDDVLPDGIPSFAAFKDQAEASKTKVLAANEEAIPKALEQLKTSSRTMFREKINQAIMQAVTELEEDLSDDTLDFLGAEETQALRQDMIAMAKEYGNSRLDKADDE